LRTKCIAKLQSTKTHLIRCSWRESDAIACRGRAEADRIDSGDTVNSCDSDVVGIDQVKGKRDIGIEWQIRRSGTPRKLKAGTRRKRQRADTIGKRADGGITSYSGRTWYVRSVDRWRRASSQCVESCIARCHCIRRETRAGDLHECARVVLGCGSRTIARGYRKGRGGRIIEQLSDIREIAGASCIERWRIACDREIKG